MQHSCRQSVGVDAMRSSLAHFWATLRPSSGYAASLREGMETSQAGSVASRASPSVPESALDNPVWNSLGTRHADRATSHPLARRYQADFTTLGGVGTPTPESFAALLALTAVGQDLSIFSAVVPTLPGTWEMQRQSPIVQMIRRDRTPLPEPPCDVTPLSAEDADAMLTLVDAARPGPFRRRTVELGSFMGVRAHGQLLAMAGERMWIGDFRELSGVCTHPDARGQGLSRALMSRVVNGMLRKGQTPFLHVLNDNSNAIRIYEGLGFVRRIEISLVSAKRMA
jgi:ribosomal protein S18 acetylase RimI-like enzyme